MKAIESRSRLARAALATGALAALAMVRASAAPPTISLWYGSTQSFGALGHPQRWVNVLGNVADSNGIADLEYSLNGGPFVDARPRYGTAGEPAIGPDNRRLNRAGDFNIELDRTQLLPGSNSLVIRATDSAQEIASENVTLSFSAITSWPETYSVNWSNVTILSNAVEVVDGKWSYNANGARPVELGYDRVLAIGDASWDDYELLLPVTLHGIDTNGFNPISVSPGFGVTFRWNGHSTGPDDPDAYPHYYWWPAGGGFWYDAGNGWGMSLGTWAGDLDLSTGFDIPYEATYLFRLRVETVPGQGSRYRLKAWPQAQQEPTGWLLDGVETLQDERYGSIIFVAHHTDVTVGNFSVTRLSDPNPPILSAMHVLANPSSAIITWRTNEPATSVVAYGLTPANEIGSVSNSSRTLLHTITLTGLTENSTYHFRIMSSDIDGNQAASNDMSFIATSDTTPPVFSNIAVNPGAMTADVSWSTNEPATTQLRYWQANAATNSFELATYDTSHQAHLANLQVNRQYFYRVMGEDKAANAASSTVGTFHTLASGFSSDDFSACSLDGAWSFVDPTGAATYQLTGQQLRIDAVPNGVMHDAWISGLNVPRLRQAAADGDFTLEVKFDSAPTVSFQSEGILIEEAAQDVRVLRIEFHHYAGAAKFFVASLFGQNFDFHADEPILIKTPMYIQVARTGNTWLIKYKLADGPWTTAASFVQPMQVTHLSFYAGNGESNGNTALVDYFYDASAPIGPEDPCSATADYNANGIPDACECGLPDCDSNGIPDIVELNEDLDFDCNSNGLPDRCDPDCDGDGVPDVCESPTTFDASDFPAFENCLAGAGHAAPLQSATGCGCARFDADHDGDVDLRDFQAFQRGFAP